MIRTIRLLVCLAVVLTTLFAAGNSQSIKLSYNSLVGGVELPQGPCKISWEGNPGSQVQLTLVAGKQTVTVPAQMSEEKHDKVTVITTVVGGVRQLREIHTKKATFLLQTK